MFTEERQQKILSILQSNKSVTVAQIGKTLYVSEATVRRDLAAMEQAGLVKRTHGGAMLLEGSGDERSFLFREQEQVAQKRKIAALAARLLADNATLFLDSSSTVGMLVPHLSRFRNLSVITTGLQNALLLSQQTEAKLYVTGGAVNSRSNSMAGSETLTALSKLHADIAVISCSGISAEHGVTDAAMEQARLKSVMLRNSETRILLCDSRKFGRTFMCETCGFDDLDFAVTDTRPDDAILAPAQRGGCRWIYE